MVEGLLLGRNDRLTKKDYRFHILRPISPFQSPRDEQSTRSKGFDETMKTTDESQKHLWPSAEQIERLRKKLHDRIAREELESSWRLEALDRLIVLLQMEPTAFHRLWVQPLLAWIIHPVSSQKRKDALKGMMNTGFAHPAFPFGASIA